MKKFVRSHQALFDSRERLVDLVTIPEALRALLEEGLIGCHQNFLDKPSIAERTAAMKVFAKARSDKEQRRIAVPRLRTVVTDELVNDIALRLQTGLRFLEMSRSAGWGEQPILLYYGQMQVVGGVTRALFEWDTEDLEMHGVRQNNPSLEKKYDLKIQPRGSFPRAMTFINLCTGIPGAFDRTWVSNDLQVYWLRDSLRTDWTLDELLNLHESRETVRHLHACRVAQSVQLQYATARTSLSRDLLVSFIASSWARYKPMKWLERQRTVDSLVINDVFKRCRVSCLEWLWFLRNPHVHNILEPHFFCASPTDIAEAWRDVKGTSHVPK